MLEYTVYGQFGIVPALVAGAASIYCMHRFTQKQEAKASSGRLECMADSILGDLKLELMLTNMRLISNPKVDKMRKKAIDLDEFVENAVKMVDDETMLRGRQPLEIRHEFIVLHILSNIAKLTHKAGEAKLLHNRSYQNKLVASVCCSQMQIQYLCYLSCNRLIERISKVKLSDFERYYIENAKESCNLYLFNKRVSLAT